MEKWKCRGKVPTKLEVEQKENLSSVSNSDSQLGKKKGKKWSFGGLLRRISRQEPVPIVSTPAKSFQKPNSESSECHPGPSDISNTELPRKIQMKVQSSEQKSQESIILPDSNSRNSEEGLSDAFGKNARKSRIKARIQAKRERIRCNSSSEEDSHNSIPSPPQFQSEDSVCSFPKNESANNKRSRGARTERYMKRMYHNDTIDPRSLQSQKQYSSETFSPNFWIAETRSPTHRKSLSYTNDCQSFGSDLNVFLCPTRSPNCYPHIQGNSCCPKERNFNPQFEESRIGNCRNNNRETEPSDPVRKPRKIQPPEPPPRAFQSKLMPAMRFSLQHSDIENHCPEENHRDINCNSLDRGFTKINSNYPISSRQMERMSSPAEDPIIPQLQSRRVLQQTEKSDDGIIDEKLEKEKKRHSKNLEEALEELETIYNSLRLSDEDLLDRAEQRSMDEYRDKIANTAVPDGSIKSWSDTSSSEITRELAWRDGSFDRCHEVDVRLKDDMAYRRMQQSNAKSPSFDAQTSISRISYLAASPSLSQREPSVEDYADNKPKSRRGTPDLTRDDVAFRSISRAVNTLKIEDPQLPFGIPVGPVTTAVESDYLHVDPSKDFHSRSLYIPQNEPDVVTDDLAFRNLRKDTNKDKHNSQNNISFVPKNVFVPEVKKKRAVRSLSADIYGIMNKKNQGSWYKEYVKLNRSPRISGSADNSNDKYHKDFSDLDINGNRSKRKNFKEKINEETNSFVNKGNNVKNGNHARKSVELEIITKNDDDDDDEISLQKDVVGKSTLSNEKDLEMITDQELSEYKQLCRELESLIMKTSEQVKIHDKSESRPDSLMEFVKQEELIQENELPDEKSRNVEDKIEIRNDKELIDEEEEEQEEEISKDVENIDEAFEAIYKDIEKEEKLTKFERITYDITVREENFIDKQVPLKKSEISEHHRCPDITERIGKTKGRREMNNDRFEVSSDDKRHDDEVVTSLNKGENLDNECASKTVNNVQSIMNVCFVTNCLTTYSIALWSLCLTLLIAIIVALSKK